MHKKGDAVCYGSKGVCKIQEIQMLDITGQAQEYYVLIPVYDPRSRVYVPKENNLLTSRMRPALSAKEAKEFVGEFESAEPLWQSEETKRKQYFSELLANGERREILGMIKGIYRHKVELLELGKKLHISDERFIKEGERLIHGELAYAVGIPIADAHEYIKGIIRS